MSLKIKVIDEKSKSNKKKWAKAFIQINDFEEFFDIPLDYWKICDYEKQWREGLERLARYDISCFIVAINNPNHRKFIEWWLIYKRDNKVYIQNHIIIEQIYEERIGYKPFTLETCYDFIPSYRSHTEEGNKISEWIIDWNDIIVNGE